MADEMVSKADVRAAVREMVTIIPKWDPHRKRFVYWLAVSGHTVADVAYAIDEIEAKKWRRNFIRRMNRKLGVEE
jgi:hypothetical protein